MSILNLAVLKGKRVKVNHFLMETLSSEDVPVAEGIAREMARVMPAGHRIEVRVMSPRPRMPAVPIYACLRDPDSHEIVPLRCG